VNIVTSGEALIDFKDAGDLVFRGYVGGSPLNVAVAAARLGAGVGFAAQVSTDLFGERIVAHLRANGVSEDLLLRSDAPTTLAFVSEIGGDAHFSFMNAGAADTLYDPRPRPTLPTSVRFLEYGSISLLTEPSGGAIAELVALHAERLTTVFDPNVRPALIPDRAAYLAKLEGWLALARIVKVSAQDLDWLYPEQAAIAAAAAWLRHGPEAVVVTRGSEGAWLLRLGREPLRVPAPAVEVVDTVGAGDTFTAAMMVALSEQSSPLAELADGEAAAVLRFAAAAAALNCARPGADPPRRAELESYLASESGGTP
jgi:fructokinase